LIERTGHDLQRGPLVNTASPAGIIFHGQCHARDRFRSRQNVCVGPPAALLYYCRLYDFG